jgi:hypothetical protein
MKIQHSIDRGATEVAKAVAAAILISLAGVLQAGAATFTISQPPYIDLGRAGQNSAIDAQQAADDFNLSETIQVQAVEWWGFFSPQNSPTPPSFRVRFFRTESGAIAPMPFYEATVSPLGPPTLDVGWFPTLIPSVTIQANERIWLSIVDLQPTPTHHFVWQESSIDRLTGEWGSRASENDPWVLHEGGSLAFKLRGEIVPEPSSGELLIFATSMALAIRLIGVRRE